MKTLKKAGSIIRGAVLGLAVLAYVNAGHAAPYASAITNIVLGGTNYVQFFLNEGASIVTNGAVLTTNGVTVTVVTYPSGTTNVLGTNVPAGAVNFPLGSDTSFTISCTKIGNGAPVQTSTDTGFQGWSGVTLRAIEVNKSAQYGDSFGRVYVGVTGQTVANTQLPAARGYGIYGLTPDMRQNSFFGGADPTPISTVYQTNTLTFTSAPTNGMVFVMNGITNTWTTNAITNIATQLPVTNSAAASATNLATLLIAANYPGTTLVTVSNNVVTLTCFAQSISAATYYTFANPVNVGTFATDFTAGNAGFGSGPYRMFVSDDGLVWATDATDANANVFVFGRNFEYTNKVWTVSGRLAGEAAGQHGNVNAVAVTGSLAAGNLMLWTADNDLPVPSYLQNTNFGVLGNGGLGNFGSAQETVPGDANVVYGYNIGAGPFPCTNTPVFAATIALNGGFPGGQVIGMGLGKDTNLVYASVRRFNYSDGGVQVFRKDTGARVYTSLSGTPTSPNDVFAVAGIVPVPGSGSDAGVYSNPRVSPDGRYIAILSGSQSPNNRIVVANLVNGIPDESSIVIITNLPLTSSARELAWDAADNLYSASSGQLAIRSFSLGLTTTCITSNDITGTNGSFQVILPPAAVSVVKGGDASQNYGSPIAGKFTINLTTNNLKSPIQVNFAISGTATNGVNYNITTGNVGNGVTVATNTGGGTITFPAGAYPGSGNWTANISVVPTASPTVGPTLTVGLTVQGGTTYFATPPLAAVVNIFNTGPQFFFVSAAAAGNTMSRAIANDYAQFVINRWGDLNGPGNSAGNVSPKPITLNSFTLGGTAAFPADYTAGVQVYNGVAPQDGSYTVTFNAGDSSKTVIVGNPVSHLNVLVAPTNATVIISLTNSATGTNGTSQEGSPYVVNTSTVTLTEFDNAVGTKAEVVLWSDPLTNSMASNYTVVFASTNLAPTNVLPVVIPNYQYTPGGPANGSASVLSANSNSFDVQLGWPVSGEHDWEVSQGVDGSIFGNPYNPPLSPVMVANGWSNVLRMTVNKQPGAQVTQCGVNLFPTTNVFYGNYALRFDMYLAIWSDALNNFNPLSFPRQFAAFGINTRGTNCDWRLSFASGVPNGTGSNPTNADGIWYAINAADQSLTPADFDGFASPALPNSGTSDIVSGTAVTQAGVFKRPPFPTTDGAGAGTPINQWVNVSVETHAGTNVSLYIDSAKVLSDFALTNNSTSPPNAAPNPQVLSGLWTNGLPMLGYLQPYSAQSDESAFVYFSNVRVVEISPYVILHPTNSYLILSGTTNLTFNSAATYATAPLTNGWFKGATAPTTLLQPVAVTNGTNLADTVTLTNVTAGTAIFSVYSDPAGSVTSFVAQVEVIVPQTNAVAALGGNGTFTVTPSGPSRTTSPFAIGYLWKTNGIALANGTKYSGVTNAALTVSNVQTSDTLVTYACTVTNIATNFVGNLFQYNTAQSLTTPPSTLTIATPPAGVTVSPDSQTNLWGSSASFTTTVGSGTGPFAYAWKRGSTALAGATKYSGTNAATLTISNLNQADAGSYTVGVSNIAGNTVSSPSILVVLTPPPSFATGGSVHLTGGNVTLAFSSTNVFDKTNSFTLQSSPIVEGPYTNVPGSSFTTNASGFQVTVPQTSSSNMFYRLLHAQ